MGSNWKKRRFMFLFWSLSAFLIAVPQTTFAKVKKRDAFPSIELNLIKVPSTKTLLTSAMSRNVASLDAAKISVQDFKGKVVLIDFWASWCEPCKISLPAYDKFQTKYKKKGLVVLGVNVDSDEAIAREFINAHKIGFPVAFDPGQKLATKLEIGMMPTSYLVDRKGNIRSIRQGFRPDDAAEVEKSIRKTL